MRQQIIDEIKKELEGMVEEGTAITFSTTEKNNGVKYQTVMLKKPDQKVVPMIYIDEQIKAIVTGRTTARQVAQNIVRINKEQQNDKIPDAIGNFGKEMILDKVGYQIINKEKNLDRLADVPHKDFLDLAVMYRVEVMLDESTSGTILVHNNHMEKIGISFEELDEAAKRNTERNGFLVRPLAAVLSKMMGLTEEEAMAVSQNGDMTHIMTNEKRIHGAAIMLYSNYFEELAEKLHDDLFIIPSSVHELLALPAKRISKEAVERMVEEVNDTDVDDDEILSYTVYRYSREEKKLIIA